ncbi:efflux RND transporter periplasmic adaptor subunit [Thalassospira marina]|uniref:Efflux transporter periplasmic adaptor subunit n=1 Tax=Thalassospira marina TaxID=2048283 RepID=A0A2N3KGP4_9PROT|nr:HlyD family secretion protein [Thalassospira marina]PKR49715.1 efflux transporter periplasmic adaptor subunit [Thalassospira marina]
MKKWFSLAGRFVVSGVLVVAAVIAGMQLWDYYMNDPWTRDGRISADVVAIAPDVSGLVSTVHVGDNQHVKAGDLLFEIDTARFKVALGQAQARLDSAIASRDQAEREVRRYKNLSSDAVSRQKKEQVVTALATAKASVELAQADLDLAKLNLDRTRVVAPVDGTLTNFSLRPGNYVGAGTAIAALIDGSSYYVAGYFEETKLPRIAVGDRVEVKLMGEQHPIYGHVASISAGIQDSERTGATGSLANVKPTFSWVRLAQRVPVRVALDDVPASVRLVAGRSATVRLMDETANSPFANLF